MIWWLDCLQDKSRADDAAVTTDSVSLSVDIEQLTAELRDVGHHRDPDSSSYQHVSSNLIRTSLAVLKLEKQTRVQKVRMLLFAHILRHYTMPFVSVFHISLLNKNLTVGRSHAMYVVFYLWNVHKFIVCLN